MGKIIVSAVLLMCALILVVSTMEVAAVTANFDGCHGICEKDCTAGGGTAGFCTLKCNNFCADNVLVSLTNEKDKQNEEEEQDNHSVDNSAAGPLPADPVEDIKVEVSN